MVRMQCIGLKLDVAGLGGDGRTMVKLPKHKRDDFYRRSQSTTVQQYLHLGIDAARLRRNQERLREFAKLRELPTDGEDWVMLAIEAAALEHPLLAEFEMNAGRPRNAAKLRKMRDLLERRRSVRARLLDAGVTTISDRKVALEMAREDFLVKHGREPTSNEDVDNVADSYRGKIRYAEKAVAANNAAVKQAWEMGK